MWPRAPAPSAGRDGPGQAQVETFLSARSELDRERLKPRSLASFLFHRSANSFFGPPGLWRDQRCGDSAQQLDGLVGHCEEATRYQVRRNQVEVCRFAVKPVWNSNHTEIA